MRKINTDLPVNIYSWTITPLIDLIEQDKQDAEISWNSWGGSVGSGQMFIDYLNNKEHKLNANVSGYAASMGTSILPFFDHVKGAKQADLMIHSAVGGAKSTLKHTNEFLYSALSKKIKEDKFKEITGFDLKTVMFAEDENRVDVWFTGQQAFEMGLFDEVYDLLDKSASFENVDFNSVNYEVPENIKAKYSKQAKIDVKLNKNEMEIKDVTASMLQSGNKDVYESIFNAGKSAVSQTNRTNDIAFIKKYAKYDPERAIELIEKGASLSIEEIESFIEKKFAKTEVENFENGSEKEVTPAQKVAKVDEKTDEQKEIEAEKSAILDYSGLEVKE